jgi:two-component system, NarL family, sensor histidine kinase DesK
MTVRLSIFNALRGRLYPDDPDIGDMPVLLLAYLVFLFMPWIVGASASLSMTLLSLALFLPLYFLQWQNQRLLLIACGMWLIWLVFVRENWGTQTYIIYACAVVSSIPQLRTSAAAFLALIASTIVVLLLNRAPLEGFIMPTVIGGLVFAFGRIDLESRRQQRFLRSSLQEISKLAERNERDRIARDVHDLLGHSLTLIALKADLAGKQIAQDPEAARISLQDITRTARESLSEVRQVVHGMRAAQLSVELAKSKLACEVADIQLQSEIQADVKMPRAVEDVVASVLRESINNVIRHAKARSVHIALREQQDALVLTVRDDGKGKSLVEGQGLRSMRERAEGIAATIEYRADAGVLVTLKIPREAPERASGTLQQVGL